MRKIQAMAAFIAAVAFTALTVAGASATLWLKKTTATSPTVAEATSVHGVGEVHHLILGVETTIRCSGLAIGKVGPGAQDLGELGEELNGTKTDLFSCENIKNCVKPIVHVLNLPGASELLLLSNGTTADHGFADGHGLPKLETLCEGGLKVSCESLVNALFDENLANGALFLSTKEGTLTKNCSDGGESWGTGMAEVLGFNVS